jgi:hypothetical protein
MGLATKGPFRLRQEHICNLPRDSWGEFSSAGSRLNADNRRKDWLIHARNIPNASKLT